MTVPAQQTPGTESAGTAPGHEAPPATPTYTDINAIGQEVPVAMDLDRLTDEIAAESAPPTLPSSPQRLHELGVTTDLLTAAELLHIGRTKAYKLARDGEFPVPVLRIGRTYIVTVAHLIELLGLDERAS